MNTTITADARLNAEVEALGERVAAAAATAAEEEARLSALDMSPAAVRKRYVMQCTEAFLFL
jgi:hypothetical protein